MLRTSLLRVVILSGVMINAMEKELVEITSSEQFDSMVDNGYEIYTTKPPVYHPADRIKLLGKGFKVKSEAVKAAYHLGKLNVIYDGQDYSVKPKDKSPVIVKKEHFNKGELDVYGAWAVKEAIEKGGYVEVDKFPNGQYTMKLKGRLRGTAHGYYTAQFSYYAVKVGGWLTIAYFTKKAIDKAADSAKGIGKAAASPVKNLNVKVVNKKIEEKKNDYVYNNQDPEQKITSFDTIDQISPQAQVFMHKASEIIPLNVINPPEVIGVSKEEACNYIYKTNLETPQQKEKRDPIDKQFQSEAEHYLRLAREEEVAIRNNDKSFYAMNSRESIEKARAFKSMVRVAGGDVERHNSYIQDMPHTKSSYSKPKDFNTPHVSVGSKSKELEELGKQEIKQFDESIDYAIDKGVDMARTYVVDENMGPSLPKMGKIVDLASETVLNEDFYVKKQNQNNQEKQEELFQEEEKALAGLGALGTAVDKIDAVLEGVAQGTKAVVQVVCAPFWWIP